MAVIKFSCFKCTKEIEVIDRVGRRDECDQCKSDLHCCMNCKFYDPKAYNSCLESTADVVKEKDRANFCDYFTPGAKSGAKGTGKDDLLAAAEALFKKK